MGVETIGAMAVGSMVAGAVGSGVSAYGAYEQGKAQKYSYQYQAAVAKNNQDIAKANASYIRASGETEATIKGVAQRQQMGQIVAKEAASGLDINSGTPERVRESQASVNSFDQMMIRSNAERAAYGSEIEAANQANQRTIDITAGDEASRAGALNAFTSLVGGASSVSDKWLKFSQAGAFG